MLNFFISTNDLVEDSTYQKQKIRIQPNESSCFVIQQTDKSSFNEVLEKPSKHW